jgi:hypothetical protein
MISALGFPSAVRRPAVGAGGRVRAQLGEHDPPQGMVGLAVTVGAALVTGDFPDDARSRRRRGTALTCASTLAMQSATSSTLAHTAVSLLFLPHSKQRVIAASSYGHIILARLGLSPIVTRPQECR